MALGKVAYAVTKFFVSFDGQDKGGWINSFDPPTIEADKIGSALGPDGETQAALGNPNYGPAKCALGLAHIKPWMTVMNSVFDKACTEFNVRVDLANHDFKSKRAIDMKGCLITEIGLPKLSAGDGKKLAEMTFSWEVETCEFLKGDDKVITGVIGNTNKNLLASNFEPVGMPGGIQSESVIDVETGKMTAKIGKEHVGMFRHHTKHYAAWEVAGLKTTHSSIAYDTALAYVNKVLKDGAITDDEYVPWSIDMKDQTMKKVLGTINYTGTACQKFTWSPQLKAGGDTMSNFTIDWVLQTIRYEPKV